MVRAFLDGLLPEGEPRRAIARELGVRAEDTYGLVSGIGRDCAGAVIIQPADDPPPATAAAAEPITDAELSDLVANLRSAPLGVGGDVRVSLAGVQEKLVLTRMPGGGWGRPVGGAPSTHILKPEIAAFPYTVENEALCMRFARHLGLAVPRIETIEIAGRRVIVVERYDRTVAPDGSVERIHQEDLCQATGTPPEAKYEDDGGPSLARVAEIIALVARVNSLPRLLEIVTVNVLIGNGDAHAKNLSLLHERTGAMSVAPAYDLLSTLYYRDNRLAMYIDDVRRMDRVTTQRIVNEAARWGMAEAEARAVVGSLLAAAPEALAAASAETPGLPAGLASTIRAQLERLG